MSTKNINRRMRNWRAVVYPESAPENWQQILNEKNIKWACSPLHDKDLDDDNKPKKAHWHIVICFPGNKSFEQVVEDITEPIHAPIPKPCADVRGAVRYFIHKDHPHKYQYEEKDIQAFGGFDLGDVLALSKTEKTQLIIDITNFIREWDIKEYWDIIFYAIDERPEWVDIVQGNSIYFERLLKSNRHRPRMDGVDNDGVVNE